MNLKENPYYYSYGYFDKVEEELEIESPMIVHASDDILKKYGLDKSIIETYVPLAGLNNEQIIKIIEYYRSKGAWERNKTLLQLMEEYGTLGDRRYHIICNSRGLLELQPSTMTNKKIYTKLDLYLIKS